VTQKPDFGSLFEEDLFASQSIVRPVSESYDYAYPGIFAFVSTYH
jgi:hypothetical protein